MPTNMMERLKEAKPEKKYTHADLRVEGRAHTINGGEMNKEHCHSGHSEQQIHTRRAERQQQQKTATHSHIFVAWGQKFRITYS